MVKILQMADLHYGFGGLDHSREIFNDFFSSLQEEKDIDAVILPGDIISHSQSQWDGILSMIRGTFPTQPILIVMGNHDYWSDPSLDGKLPFHQMELNRAKALRKFKIIYLEHHDFVINDIHIFGFDGWYGTAAPPSNDYNYIPKYINMVPFNDWFFDRATKRVAEIVKMVNNVKKTVVVTHFEPNDESMGAPADWLDQIKRVNRGNMVFCCGHTHRRKCYQENNTFRFINSGGDYNQPDYTTFLVE
jgi:predicted phosphodiesterase